MTAWALAGCPIAPVLREGANSCVDGELVLYPFRENLEDADSTPSKFRITAWGNANGSSKTCERSTAFLAVSAPAHLTRAPGCPSINHPPSMTPWALRSSGNVLFACSSARTKLETG